MSQWRKSYDVTIQMKALYLYFHMILFVCHNFTKWNWEIWSKFTFGHIWQWKGYLAIYIIPKQWRVRRCILIFLRLLSAGAIHISIQLFRERLSEKMHATNPKGIVGGFECSVLQRNLKEWHGGHGQMFASA